MSLVGASLMLSGGGLRMAMRRVFEKPVSESFELQRFSNTCLWQDGKCSVVCRFEILCERLSSSLNVERILKVQNNTHLGMQGAILNAQMVLCPSNSVAVGFRSTVLSRISFPHVHILSRFRCKIHAMF